MEESRMSHAIDNILDELDELARNSTKVPGMRKRAMVDSVKLAAIAADLRESVPHDVLEAGEVLKQKESIVNQAYLEAKRLRESANQEVSAITMAARNEHESLVSESELVKAAEIKAQEIKDEAHRQGNDIVQEAQRQAFRLVDDAETTASVRREGADQYSREVLFSIEERLSQMLGQVRRGIDALGTQVESAEETVAEASVNGNSAK
jgi:vacuolar-type H+-ATPase subunit H